MLDDGRFRIILASADNSGQPQQISANIHILRSCCSCAEGLPADPQEWDLRQLQINGTAVQREAVVAWLNCAYSRILDSVFEEQQSDDADYAYYTETVAGLAQLLAFADAVGSRAGILRSCLMHIDELVLQVQLPFNTFRLQTDGRAYYISSDHCLTYCSPTARSYNHAPFPSDEAEETFLQQAAQQTEALLFEAQRLQLQPLMDRLHSFIASGTFRNTAIFYGRLEDIFTERVLTASLPAHASPGTKEAWISSVLTLPCGVSRNHNVNHLLDVRSLYDHNRHRGPINFSASLLQDFMGSRAGDRVDVELDLFDRSVIQIGRITWPVQVLLGHAVVSDEDLEDIMSSKLRPGPADSDREMDDGYSDGYSY